MDAVQQRKRWMHPIIREKKLITWNVLPCQHERVSSRVDNYRQNTSASFTDSLIHSTFKGMKNEDSVIIYSPSSSSKLVWMSLFCLNTKEYILKNEGNSSSGASLTTIVFIFPTMIVNGTPKTAWLQTFFKISSFVFGRTRNSCRFGTTWGWVNDDSIFIFGWIIPLTKLLSWMS